MCELYCCTLRRWSTPLGVLGMPAALHPCACELRCLAVRLKCRPTILHACRTTSPYARARIRMTHIYKGVMGRFVLPLFYHIAHNPFIYRGFCDSTRIWTAFLENFWKGFCPLCPSACLQLKRVICAACHLLRSPCSPAGICALCCTIGHKYTTFLHTLCRITAHWKTLRSSKVFWGTIPPHFAPSALPAMPTSSHFVSHCIIFALPAYLLNKAFCIMGTKFTKFLCPYTFIIFGEWFTCNSTKQNFLKKFIQHWEFCSLWVNILIFNKLRRGQKYFAQKFLGILSPCKRYVLFPHPFLLYILYIYIATPNRAKDTKKPPFSMNDGWKGIWLKFFVLYLFLFY